MKWYVSFNFDRTKFSIEEIETTSPLAHDTYADAVEEVEHVLEARQRELAYMMVEVKESLKSIGIGDGK